MKVAYLASSVTLPGSPVRRADAFEHDYQIAEFAPALQAKDIDLVELDWRSSETDWSAYDAAMIGTTWDYSDHPVEFLETLEKIEASGVALYNSSRQVRWNSRKTYLKDLAQKGVKTIPTLWLSKPSAEELQKAYDTLQSDDLVVKRQIGAGAQDQIRIRRGETLSDYAHDAMIQPFLKSIQTEGEYSFIMIDGELSHALIKRAKSGDYRIQSLYGGMEEKVHPSADEIEAARSVLAHLDEMPLYARVDMVRGTDGALWLMELELIEPNLYPEQADHLGTLLATALSARLSSRA